MFWKVMRCCALILLTSIPLIHAYGSHPKCTKIAASKVYHGTCYFQYVSGKGYVKRTCPSGTLYDEEACDCVGISTARESRKSISTHSSAEDDHDDDNDDDDNDDNGRQSGISEDTTSFIRSLIDNTNAPLSLIKFLFSTEGDHGHYYDQPGEDDREEGDEERDENEGENDRSLDDFENDHTYGGRSNDHNSETESDRGDGSVEIDSGSVNTNGENGYGIGASEFNGGHVRADDTDDGRDGKENDDDDKDGDDEDGNKSDNEHIRYVRPYRHGYRSIYSVKGMLSRDKQYRYEDLFRNLYDDDDDDDEREPDDEYRIVKKYRKIYHEKLDGVLEYVGDIFDDIFDDDFDDFYEDLFDNDGYDDCFNKKYRHIFEDDFENELEEKYDEFDDFFKNYDKIKSLLSGFGDKDEDDDDDDDDDDDEHEGPSRSDNVDEYGAGGRPFDGGRRSDDNDDSDNDGVHDDERHNHRGDEPFESFGNRFDDGRHSGPRDSRLFDFRKTLKQPRRQEQSRRSIMDSFYERSSKH